MEFVRASSRRKLIRGYKTGAFLAFTLASMVGCRGGDPALVSIANGRVRGVADSVRGVISFLGIPYAAPPVDSLRWRPPRNPASWSDTRIADRPGAACPQPPFYGMYFKNVTAALGGDTAAVRPLAEQSEDCLTVNVWTPDTKGRQPVMVYIHGGAGTTGSGIDQVIDGTRLAPHGVVLVTFNYRLGPLGFLAHPVLSRESPDNISGNYALLDQVRLLEWVRENIAAFGGDPNRVTILGQSAGASFVGHLMSMPLARGLFHRAIAQSGTGLDMALPLRDSSGNASGETMGIRLVAALGLTDSSQLLSQLRALPPADIIRTAFRNQAVPDGPVIDGHILPQAPHTVFASGQQAPVPLIVGSNARELSTLGFLAGEPPTNATSWSDRIRQEYGGVAPILIAAYGELAGRDAARGYEQVATDQIFKAPALLMARGQVRAGQPAWLYQFAAVPSGPGGKALGAFHGAELPILFGKPWPGHTPFNQDEEKLHEAMMDYWVAFATRGDPNGEGRPDWPALGMGEPALLVLDETIRTTTVGDTTALDALMRRVPPS